MASLKIASLCQFYAPFTHGGAEVSAQLLAEALVGRGHRVVVGTTLVQSLPVCEEVNGVTVNRINWGNLYTFDGSQHSAIQKAAWHLVDSWNPVAFLKAKKWLASHAPDVVQTHNLAGMSVAVWSAAHALGIPVIHTVHDYYLLCLRSSMHRNGGSCMQACGDCRLTSVPKKHSAKKVHAVVYITKHMRDVHAKAGVFADLVRSHVVGGVIPPGTRSVGPPDAAGRITIGYLGRLAPSKGIEWLLEFLSQSHFASVVKCYVAGKGDVAYVDELKERFGDARVVFLGQVLPQVLFDKIDVLVVPSLWDEPMGRVPLEAASAGIPSIVANRGGLPETVTHGATGFVFDPNDPISLTKCLAALASDKSRLLAMKNNVFESSLASSEDQVASRYEEIYHESLAVG